MTTPRSQIYIRIKQSDPPPDPAVFCPANGYIVDPAYYEPPIEIDDPSGDYEIVILLDDSLGRFECYSGIGATSGSGTVDIYDTGGNLLGSAVSTGTNHEMLYNLPTNNTGAYYVAKIKPTSAATPAITVFKQKVPAGYTAADIPWIQVKINASLLTDIFLKGQIKLKDVKFLCDLNALVTPTSEWINGCGFPKVVFPYMNSLTTMEKLIYMNKYIREVVFQDSYPEVTTIKNAVSYNYSLMKVTLPSSLPKCTNSDNLLDYDYSLEADELTMPPLPECTQCNQFVEATQFRKITFQSSPKLNRFGYAFRDMPKLEEVVFPPVLPSGVGSFSAMFTSVTTVKKIVLPGVVNGDFVAGYYITDFITMSCNDFYSLSECDLSALTVLFSVTLNTKKLISFYQPTWKLLSLSLTNPNALVKYLISVEIDWANSFSDASTGVIINLSYNNLDSTEIDRIFTALPTIAVAKTINVTNNPGYAGCTKAIATAKGWTVT